MQWMTGRIFVGLLPLAMTALASPARADILGRVIVGGVTNRALTEVTQTDCPTATGAGADACEAADAVVDVHRDISNAVDQQVQRTCQDATGAGEDVCQGIDDVNSFKKQLSEQIDHIHLFGSHHQAPPSQDNLQSSPSQNSAPTPANNLSESSNDSSELSPENSLPTPESPSTGGGN